MTPEEKVQLISISDIRFARKNVRTTFDDEKLRELANSIRQRGVLQPIICRITRGQPELIAGERRLRASKLAGLKKIPVIIRESTDSDVTYDQIIENLQREELSTEDQYRALKALRETGLAVGQISKMTGLSTTSIQRVLVLETLKPSIRQREDLSPYAKSFIARAPEEVQNVLANRIANEEIGTKQLGHDIMPAIAEALDEDTFTKQEKKFLIEKIVREASSDRPGRAIVRQERGKKKLHQAGIDVQITSNQALEEFVNSSERYRDKLVALQATRFDHLDPRLVIGLLDLFKEIQTMLTDILNDVAIARRRR
jgi:ParB family transcriptional regulator, chromosome partitioning protein